MIDGSTPRDFSGSQVSHAYDVSFDKYINDVVAAAATYSKLPYVKWTQNGHVGPYISSGPLETCSFKQCAPPKQGALSRLDHIGFQQLVPRRLTPGPS